MDGDRELSIGGIQNLAIRHSPNGMARSWMRDVDDGTG